MINILRYECIQPHPVKITGSESITVSQPVSAILFKSPFYKIVRPRKNFVDSFAYPCLSQTLKLLNTYMLISEKKDQHKLNHKKENCNNHEISIMKH